MRNLGIGLLALGILVLVNMTSQAIPVQFNYEGVISLILINPGDVFPLDIGDTFTGNFIYDTDAVDSDPDPTRASYSMGGSFISEGVNEIFPEGTLSVYYTSYQTVVEFGLWNGQDIMDSTWLMLVFPFFFDDLRPPTELDLSLLEVGTPYDIPPIMYPRAIGIPGNAQGTISSLESVPIPEPTTVVLMGCGLVGLLGVVVRQRRKVKVKVKLKVS